jgi:hypothetical protein
VLSDFQLNMGETRHDSGLKDGMDDMTTGKCTLFFEKNGNEEFE